MANFGRQRLLVRILATLATHAGQGDFIPEVDAKIESQYHPRSHEGYTQPCG